MLLIAEPVHLGIRLIQKNLRFDGLGPELWWTKIPLEHHSKGRGIGLDLLLQRTLVTRLLDTHLLQSFKCGTYNNSAKFQLLKVFKDGDKTIKKPAADTFVSLPLKALCSFIYCFLPKVWS